MWGGRVIIPPRQRTYILDQLHEAHSGVVKMKNLARSYVWWPGIDAELEVIAKKCPGCRETQNEPAIAPLHPWEWPSRPWQRVHVDFCGPFLGHMMLVAVDAHSKWPEVICMTSTTAERTIEVLREIFSRNGVCEQLVSDNGPQFTSEEFQEFIRTNGITHIKSVVAHPATNGLAERLVQSLKNALKSAKHDAGTLKRKLANWLLVYRNTPHTTTNETPAQLFLGRPLRMRIDLIRPSLDDHVRHNQFHNMLNGQNHRLREFSVGQDVAVRDYRGQNKWINATVVKRMGPLTYEVKTTQTAAVWRRHVDQMRAAIHAAEQPTAAADATLAVEYRSTTTPIVAATAAAAAAESSIPVPQAPSIELRENTAERNVDNGSDSNSMLVTPPSHSAPERRYPCRDRRPPDRLIEQLNN